MDCMLPWYDGVSKEHIPSRMYSLNMPQNGEDEALSLKPYNGSHVSDLSLRVEIFPGGLGAFQMLLKALLYAALVKWIHW